MMLVLEIPAHFAVILMKVMKKKFGMIAMMMQMKERSYMMQKQVKRIIS